MPGRIVFSTTADGAGSPTERMRISQNGDVDIGQTGGGVKLAVAGAVGLLGQSPRPALDGCP